MMSFVTSWYEGTLHTMSDSKYFLHNESLPDLAYLHSENNIGGMICYIETEGGWYIKNTTQKETKKARIHQENG